MTDNFDVKEFWIENDECMKTFTRNKPRIPIRFWFDDHYLLEDMKLPSTIRYYSDFEYRLELHKTINDKIEKAIGKRFYIEDEDEFPEPERFEIIMGSYRELREGGTPWLESRVKSIDDVKKIIENAEKLDMKKEVFPEGWLIKKENYEKITGKKVRLGGNFSRGPATMATSILGTTNTCMFSMEEPDVMDDFFRVLSDNLVKYHGVLMHETGHDTREGYSINDDNCYLFTPDTYERFCAPVLKKLFNEFAPAKEHLRFQHSDSAMGHLMGILNDLGVNQVNLGPTIHPIDIRIAMPDVIIHGQIPPFTLRNGTREEIIDMVKRDIESVGSDGKLIECPAGSVAGGTSLENIRTYLRAVHTYGKF
jgi:uroporphyrinogen decarboxylase